MADDAKLLLEKFAETEVTVWTTDPPRFTGDALLSGRHVFSGLRPAIEFVKANSGKPLFFDVHVHTSERDIILDEGQLRSLLILQSNR